MSKDRTRKACLQYGYEEGCIVPGCRGRTRLHHIVPSREGGSDGLNNLMAICHDHEMKIHNAGLAARAMELRPDLDIYTFWHLPRTLRKRALRSTISTEP